MVVGFQYLRSLLLCQRSMWGDHIVMEDVGQVVIKPEDIQEFPILVIHLSEDSLLSIIHLILGNDDYLILI